MKSTNTKKIVTALLFVLFLKANAQNPVQEFTFNGNLNSSNDKTIAFLGAPVFVNDRMGTPKSALRLINKAYQAVVGDLPQGNKPKTISVWVKFNAVNTANNIFNYGTPVNGQYFALLQQPVSAGNSDLSLIGWGDNNNMTAEVPLAKDTWYMYSVTYDGNVSKIYRNGQLLKTASDIQRAAKGYILTIGKLNTAVSINADIDDLRLYSVAMTDEQVLEAYNSSKPTTAPAAESMQSASASKKAITPAAKAEVNKGSKNIEVFLDGKKIMDTNGSNISDLPEGSYLIKVTNKK
ncbi:LamG domain-containing protein [Flavobacterium gelatinilyticum]|uniref:LamG domain-containing protein n=1 Tax=Flavobacterium gelatinilyticum TaxID=3003260 RepID=UPI0024810829|nr:LamG domain-containing protein [Flavobacterium gelatinilyticum]